MTVSDYTHTAGPAAGAAGSSGAVFSDTLSTESHVETWEQPLQ